MLCDATVLCCKATAMFSSALALLLKGEAAVERRNVTQRHSFDLQSSGNVLKGKAAVPNGKARA